MDENYVMSTSVLQYLEEIRTFMKENNTIRPDENFDLFAVSKSPYEDNTTVIFCIFSWNTTAYSFLSKWQKNKLV